MRILAIDPGSEQSAWLVYDAEAGELVRCTGGVLVGAKMPNELVRLWILRQEVSFDLLAIEYVHLRGMPIMQQVLDTQFWAGRFVEAWHRRWRPIDRKDVKMHLCGQARAKDPNIRQALIDRFRATGGGKTPSVGVKSKPGPLYGMRLDLWSALGIAITAAETTQDKEA